MCVEELMQFGHTISAMLSLSCDLLHQLAVDAHFRISTEVVGHSVIFGLVFSDIQLFFPFYIVFRMQGLSFYSVIYSYIVF